MGNLRDHPGYTGNIGPPEDFVPDTHLWSANHCDNAPFGGRLRGVDERDDGGYPCEGPFPCTPQTLPTPDNPSPATRLGPDFYPGFADLASLHPMRAMHLAGLTASITVPGQGLELPTRGPFSPVKADWTIPPIEDVEDFGHGVWEGLENVEAPVRIDFTAKANLRGSGARLDVYLNGSTWVGEMFRDTGKDWPTISRESLVIQADTWNRAIRGDGTLFIQVTPSWLVSHQSGSWVEWDGSSDAEDVTTVEHLFVNEEVCFSHAGYGYAVAENGFTVPATLHQPNRTDPVQASIGAFWRVKTDELAGPDAVGFAVAVLPVGLPPAVESLFASYPVWCHTPA